MHLCDPAGKPRQDLIFYLTLPASLEAGWGTLPEDIWPVPVYTLQIWQVGIKKCIIFMHLARVLIFKRFFNPLLS